MKHLKYPSIINHYAVTKSRNTMRLIDELWYSTEKIHGTNAVIAVTKDSFKYGGRNVWADNPKSNEKLVADFITDDHPIVQTLRKLVDNTVRTVYAYGELYGAGIQQMEYDVNKAGTRDLRLFNVILHMKDDTFKLVPRSKLDELFESKYLTRVLEVKTLREFLTDELNEESEYGGTQEGLVYQPLNEYPIQKANDNFTIVGFVAVKHKHENFLETVKAPRSPKAQASEAEMKLSLEIENYITKNRVVNVLSHGDLELKVQNIGSIIKEVQRDVIKEFMLENELEANEAEVTQVVNKKARMIAVLIKELISELK